MTTDKNKIGRFDATVVDHALGSTRDDGTGTDFVHIRFAFTDLSGKDAQISHRLFITAKSMTSEHGPVTALKVLGWDVGERGAAVEELDRKSDSNPKGGALMGAKASIVIETDTYEGKTRLRVAWVNEFGAGGVRNLAADLEGGIEAFRDRFRAALSGSAPAASARSSGAPDDDLPF